MHKLHHFRRKLDYIVWIKGVTQSEPVLCRKSSEHGHWTEWMAWGSYDDAQTARPMGNSRQCSSALAQATEYLSVATIAQSTGNSLQELVWTHRFKQWSRQAWTALCKAGFQSIKGLGCIPYIQKEFSPYELVYWWSQSMYVTLSTNKLCFGAV